MKKVLNLRARSYINWPEEPQKKARNLKFWKQVEEG